MRMARERLVTSRPVIQVALGGGTPNFLSEGQLDRLLSGLEQLWSISPEAELSVEIDPRTSTPAKLDLLLSHRFNRFSLGVQDLEESVISHFRRGQDLMQIEEVASSLRSQGCSALNFDLIYGLPGQTLETAARTAEKVIRLGPSRIALYAYAHVPWIHPHQSAVEKLGLPDPDLKLAIFLHMLDRFQDAGYEPIGMDHFARPEDPLAQALREGKLRRNFMGYSTGRGIDVLGLGASSISSMGSTYSQNEKDVPTYIEEIGNGRPPVARGFLLDRDDQIRRELIIDLFCNFTVDFEALGKRFGLDVLSYFAGELDRLEPLAKDGLVHWGARGLQATETGRFFIRNICMVFDRYLEREAGHRVYSRTV
jgi:oxygen-independent coproporphyrinogen-3 oxidase